MKTVKACIQEKNATGTRPYSPMFLALRLYIKRAGVKIRKMSGGQTIDRVTPY